MPMKTTTYQPEYIKKVDDYLKLCKDKKYEFHKSRGGKVNSYEERVKAKLPTKEGFANYIGVVRKTVYNWEQDNPDFAKAMEKLITEQFDRLVNNGLDGTYNPTIAKLLLSVNHGMVERTDVTSGGKPLPLLDYVSTRTNNRDEADTESH